MHRSDIFTRSRSRSSVRSLDHCATARLIDACRDCAFKNIMMDASALFPCGFHPISKTRLPDVSGIAPTLSRSEAAVKYYFIDFGISTRFAPQSSRLVVGTPGLDQEPPELSEDVTYDPFKLDVFLIGNLIRRELHAVSLDGYRRPSFWLTFSDSSTLI